MSNLNKQLQEIINNAIRLIAVKLDKNKGTITLIAKEDMELSQEDGDDFYRLVADKTLMLTHTWETEGNEDVYIVEITGNKTDCIVKCVTPYEAREINLFELDAHNITLLADYLLNNCY